jgi:hypothetical protein
VRRIFSILFGVVLLFFSSQKTFAVQITLSNIPATITQDNFTISASISGALTGTNYLRLDLYKEGTSNYFGETYNNSGWYSGSDGTQYLPITIQSGISWNGQIQARIGSPSKTEYDGNGNYKLRIRRYTGSGSYNSDEANENAVAIAIIFPTQTPTPAPQSFRTIIPIEEMTPYIRAKFAEFGEYDVKIAIALAKSENAVNMHPGVFTCDIYGARNSNGTVDVGLYQINSMN